VKPNLSGQFLALKVVFLLQCREG
jgi:hypothetical protein